MIEISQIFALLFLMLGPFKIIGPFAKMTRDADPILTRQLAMRAVFFSILAVLFASFLGDMILAKYSIPIPILALAAGLILFLVALQNVIQQFAPTDTKHEPVAPTLQMALNPLAFPTIVTPYGIAAVMVFMAISPDLRTKLIIGGIVIGIMLLNLATMLLTRHMGKLLFLILSILGAILGVVQVSLGLLIMYNQLKLLV
ncbi:MAG: MarC family protein [Saprospiraceae bacterium]|nr:MarC family protein [Candidatus Opimibacter skivensis]MBL0008977.1 MarC family protein [Candidatus Opimibacter skivensis]MBP6680726.1 MarC family protein [Saprospiraceae bacterium]